ncbi:MAG: response regulator transcription factor [Crocinitomicaceae bacterium]|nr:MAG: response regulator transcription factor [Crocinitomicaceae bacterium]
MYKIAVAEDNSLLAKSIQEKIGFFGDELRFKFRGINGQDLLQKLAQDSNVDVILMDIQMPEMDGIEATRQVVNKYPHIKVIMLTVLDDENHIFQAIQSGANGYILKDEPPHKLLSGILEIMQGGAPMSTGIALKALRMLRNPLQNPTEELEEKTALSVRETDVLQHLSKGFDYKQIAENLHISPSTVRKHIENIYIKLQVHNKIDAVSKAQKQRII